MMIDRIETIKTTDAVRRSLENSGRDIAHIQHTPQEGSMPIITHILHKDYAEKQNITQYFRKTNQTIDR